MSGGKRPDERKSADWLLSLIALASMALVLAYPDWGLSQPSGMDSTAGAGVSTQPSGSALPNPYGILETLFPPIRPSPTPTTMLTASPTSPLTPTLTPTPFIFFPTNTPRPTRTPRPTPTPTPTPVPTAFPGGLDPQVIIPEGSAPRMDGICSPFEYRDARAESFVDGNNTTGTVYLKHDRNRLYVCMSGALGSDPDRFVGVYLDPDHGKEAYPHGDELSLRINLISSSTWALRGADAPGAYTAASIPGWTAIATATTLDQAEYSISLTLLGCAGAFGMAVYHHWFAAPANDYGWPYSQYYDQPVTWAVAGLDTGLAATCDYLPLINR